MAWERVHVTVGGLTLVTGHMWVGNDSVLELYFPQEESGVPKTWELYLGNGPYGAGEWTITWGTGDFGYAVAVQDTNGFTDASFTLIQNDSESEPYLSVKEWNSGSRQDEIGDPWSAFEIGWKLWAIVTGKQ